ncbi:magnesium/cobalt transporter CorA [Paraburkholderia bonniea]|uniref:magnesium/cobalt transporter CorA n=1 Tax=Paraburkholderia bonniea TaxID=2152891 RepID=UPI001291F053|nr:magnesium/cobalt transporter CorA [Paraburkholderia bonniea]WJF89084.1 magnesium/cobalt transporter CorA [Paraburkholderia bonniea]WJF92400.1 magnesium/cobalt transporter CorA [Paraburkholderia bonniea]
MLINCAAYQDGRKLADIEIDDISVYVAKPECFVWVALKDPGPGELAVMQHEFGLHELAVEDVRNGHQRPKLEEYGDSLFAVLHTVEMDDEGELVIGEVDVFVGPNYVLTVRNGTRQGFQEVRARCEREPELLKHGSAFVLYALADHIVDRYFPLLEALGAEIEELEDRIFDRQNLSASRAIIEDLYSLKRRLVLLQHHVNPLLEAIGKLTGGRVPQICAGMPAYFRDVYDHLERIVKTIDGRREMIVTAVQVNLGMISLAESEVTKRLGSFAALFAVPTMIAGIYGMNFQHIPELNFKYGYPVCLAVMLGVDLILWWRFRRAGWL